MARKDPGSKPPLPPVLEGFGKKDARRDAAAAEFGRQVAGLDLGQLDEAPDLLSSPSASTEEPDDEAIPMPITDEASRPNLEPVGDDAHPPQNRRLPTQPPAALTLDLDELRPPRPPSESPQRAEGGPLPPPPKLAPRHSPAPIRRGLFSMDRPTNLLAGAAVGLLLMIYPAKKLAHNYEVSEVEPMIAELEGAIEHPLGVEAGLVEDPRKIAARIDDGRKKVRRRYITIWLLAGLPIGIGLGFAPRPGD